jgi:hypothetical protein
VSGTTTPFAERVTFNRMPDITSDNSMEKNLWFSYEASFAFSNVHFVGDPPDRNEIQMGFGNNSLNLARQ